MTNIDNVIARATRNHFFSIFRNAEFCAPFCGLGAAAYIGPPPTDYVSFHEHGTIVYGIINGDRAAGVMTNHLNTVHARLINCPGKS